VTPELPSWPTTLQSLALVASPRLGLQHVNYVVNVTRGVLFGFYIFKGERLKDDYIKLYKLGICMVMRKRILKINFLFKFFLPLFNKSIPSGMSFINQHLLILDGHGHHVTHSQNKTSNLGSFICIWHLNPKAMDDKIIPLKVYITKKMNNARSEEDCTTKEEVKNNLQWGE
jgi:hypothetical protein